MGAKGDKGDKGAKGDNGKSAYDIAVSNGFTGTESEWLASLIGQKGDKGIKGDTGEKGDKGDKGETGAKGNDGENAFEVAKAAGFSGTEQEWLASLIGKSAYELARITVIPAQNRSGWLRL